jgi:Flp pilus assembly CpaE family ATPase
MERTVGMAGLALIRSGGLLFVRAANEGRTVIEMFPKEKITTDFEVLADRVLGTPTQVPAPKAGFRISARSRQAARA